MPLSPIPVPDNPQRLNAATRSAWAQPDDRSFETDFSALAARFISRSGGGLSPELAADLALEIVLHEIVEEACVATGATGSAIVLRRDGELVCRARSGKTAPELGSPLVAAAGLSAECLRTCQIQRCDDIEADPRADVEASRRLGVLSVLVLPLLQGGELAGVFELFSSRTYAFGEREERALEALAHRTLQSLQLAAEPLVLPEEDLAPGEPLAEAHENKVLGEELPEAEGLEAAVKEPEGVDFPRRRFEGMTQVLPTAVVACAVLLAVVVLVPLAWRKSPTRAVTAPAFASTVDGPAVTDPVGPGRDADSVPSKRLLNESKSRGPVAPEAMDTDSIPAGSLSVYADGKEVFHLPPVQARAQAGETMQGTATLRAADAPEDVIELSPPPDPAIVLKRVDPVYPDEARRQHIQGPVVVAVHIGSSGEVQKVRVVSGPRVLCAAAANAVKQWQFKPRVVNGSPAEMRTLVTLKFRLPE